MNYLQMSYAELQNEKNYLEQEYLALKNKKLSLDLFLTSISFVSPPSGCLPTTIIVRQTANA